MLKLWCAGLILFVISTAYATNYVNGNIYLNVRQSVKRGCGDNGCDKCPTCTQPACKYLGGSCTSCSKTCDGETISGPQYCSRDECKCCVPRTTCSSLRPPGYWIEAGLNCSDVGAISPIPSIHNDEGQECCQPEKCLSLSPPGYWIEAGLTCSDSGGIPTGIFGDEGQQCCQPDLCLSLSPPGFWIEPGYNCFDFDGTPTNISDYEGQKCCEQLAPPPPPPPATPSPPPAATPSPPPPATPSPPPPATPSPPPAATPSPPPPAPRPKRSGCLGKWSGLYYTGVCKPDCAANGLVQTYEDNCGSPDKCCIEEPLKHCNISDTETFRSGTRFSKNCMMFECDDGTFKSDLKFNEACGWCSAKNDPHWVNFEGATFDWHGLTDGVMVQRGRGGDFCPTNYVGIGFRRCTNFVHAGATCYNNAWYGTQAGVEISIPLDSFPVVIVDGHENILPENGEIAILVGANGAEVPVIGFMKDNCVHVMGIEDEGFLVRVCKTQVIVYAYPSLKGNIAGLCGSWNGLTNDFEFRDGTLYERPKGGRKPLPSILGLDWEMPDCLAESDVGRRRRDADDIPAVSDEDPCNATQSQIDDFEATCSQALSSTNSLPQAEKDNLLADCIFDQCIAIVVSNEPELGAEFLKDTESMAVQAESAANDTVPYPPERPQALHATDQGCDWVVLDWFEPDGHGDANIIRYTIRKKDLHVGHWELAGQVHGEHGHPPVTHANITVVEPGEYIFRVVAVNEAGHSQPSEHSPPYDFGCYYTTQAATTIGVTDATGATDATGPTGATGATDAVNTVGPTVSTIEPTTIG